MQVFFLFDTFFKYYLKTLCYFMHRLLNNKMHKMHKMHLFIINSSKYKSTAGQSYPFHDGNDCFSLPYLTCKGQFFSSFYLIFFYYVCFSTRHQSTHLLLHLLSFLHVMSCPPAFLITSVIISYLFLSFNPC